MSQNPKRVLALDPITKGFGYVIFELPFRLVEWNIAYVTGEKHAGAIARFTELINHIEPDGVVLEDVAAAGSRRRYRVRRLIESLAAYIRGRGIPVHTIARSAVARRFAPEGEAATKHAIAAQLAKSFPEIAAHLPPRRKVWQSEDERMALFDALALAVTYASE